MANAPAPLDSVATIVPSLYATPLRKEKTGRLGEEDNATVMRDGKVSIAMSVRQTMHATL